MDVRIGRSGKWRIRSWAKQTMIEQSKRNGERKHGEGWGRLTILVNTVRHS